MKKTKQKSKIQPNGDGFAAASDLKSYTDLQDPLLIYAVNENEQHVFKMSTAQMKTALEMDKEGDHFMHNAYCHFDGVYHLLLKKQIVLANMNCKHKDSNYVAKFWRTLNEAFKKPIGTEKCFSLTGWLSDMASANFNEFSTIYGEDALEKVKSCEFHFKQAVERKIRGFDGDKDQFKKLAYGLLYATTPEAYESSLQLFKEFAVDAKMRDWIQWWWDVQKEKIFHAFTRFDARQSNLAEVLHAGWKHREKMGVSLLECCYFDVRDSILALNQDNVRDSCYDGRYVPNNEELTTRKRKREEERARQSGEFTGYFQIDKSDRKETNRTSRNGLLPTKKEKKV